MIAAFFELQTCDTIPENAGTVSARETLSMNIKQILLAATLSAAASSGFADPLAFANPFSDHAVLQRDGQTPIWGMAEPNAPILLVIKKGNDSVFEAQAKADAQGKWIVKTKPISAGGPYSVTVASGSTGAVTISDVLFGDIWICSGQSNMEMSYGWGLTNGKEDMEKNTYADIRLLNVPNNTSVDSLTQFKSPATWSVCTPEAAKNFSACGYFFGVALKKELPDVPIGLVDVTWSGTYIQTWLSLDSLATIPELTDAVAQRREAIVKWKAGGAEKFEKDLAEWESKRDPLSVAAIKPSALNFDDSAWTKVTLPITFENHIKKGFDGIVWYRLHVKLTAEQATAEAKIALGKIDDQDKTYVNGVQVGATDIWSAVREYAIPAGVLKAGDNLVSVCVTDNGMAGGFYDKPEALALKVGTDSISLATEWVYAASTPVGMSKPTNLSTPDANSFSACYNAMFEPLFPLAVKGAIWYQGCSNVGGADQYFKLFQAMAADWRAHLSGGDFPIYLVQLAAFQQTHEEPVESAWAQMRWVMMQLGETVKNCGAAVTIDKGHHTDIHPKDKKTVGERLARLALYRTYGRQDIVEAGPIPTGIEKRADGLVVSFKNATGLKTSDGQAVSGFQVVGADGKAVWASAAIQGETVVVTVPAGVQPSAVRYAWDDYPVCNLVNGSDLPCGPFRLGVK